MMPYMELGAVWNGAWALTSDNWSAVGTWAAVGVAIAAAFFALRQVREARISRDEQSQPNVVMFTEPMQADWQFLELVIKNYGQTPAYDVRVSLDTTPEVSPDYQGADITKVAIPDQIPILAPGQEWRALWDHAPDHFAASGIKSRHEGVITYRGDRKKRQHWFAPWRTDYARHESPVLLDFELLKDTRRVNRRKIHDVANTLDKQLKNVDKQLTAIANTMKAYGSEHKGVWVYPADPNDERQYQEEQRRQNAEESRRNRAQLDGMVRRLLPHQFPPQEEPTSQPDEAEPHSTEPTGPAAPEAPAPGA